MNNVNRIYITGEEVAEAMLDAGLIVNPECCDAFRFNHVGGILSDIVRDKVREEIKKFGELLTC